MKLIKLTRKKTDTQFKTLRALSTEECQQVAGGTCGVCRKFSTTPKKGNRLPSHLKVIYEYELLN